MSEALVIQSHRGPYTVHFVQEALRGLASESMEKRHFIVDANVATLYREDLAPILNNASTLVIDATEAAKTLDCFTDYIEILVSQSVRRDHLLVAIGGGIIQDITAFLSTTLLRGLHWRMSGRVPVTALCAPTTSLLKRDTISPDRVRVKKRSDMRCRWAYMAWRRSQIMPSPTRALR